jgi:hypothetical protein
MKTGKILTVIAAFIIWTVPGLYFSSVMLPMGLHPAFLLNPIFWFSCVFLGFALIIWLPHYAIPYYVISYLTLYAAYTAYHKLTTRKSKKLT